MADFSLSDSDLKELRDAFIEQAREMLDSLPEHITAFESSADPESLRALKRVFHTIKGDSRALGFSELSTFAHKAEDLISGIKEGGADKSAIDTLFECADALRAFIEAIAQGEEPDIRPMIEVIDAYNRGMHESGRFSTKTDFGGLSFLKIEASRVDRIMDLVGELIIIRSMLGQAVSEIERGDSNPFSLQSVNSAFERHIADLQRSVMKLRMLPIRHVFRKFPRIVRDLSAETSKPIKLQIEGEDTELDKSIIDVIGEPLLHLVRNAVDHGIEKPPERKIKGKPETGTLTLRAFHQGNQIVIEVKDDGAGIDTEVLKKTAIQKGILSYDEAMRLGKEDALNLIYHSGLSTAERTTEVSGRGVGMDIVKQAVESLRGIIEIHTEQDKGTTVTLRLPLTRAVIKAILFKESCGIFALPLSSVVEILKLEEKDIATVTGMPMIRHRTGLVPIVSVDWAAAGDWKTAIIIGVAQTRVAVLAERILGEESLVIKALEGVASAMAVGGSILGDGRVVLILDPLVLIKKGKRT